MIENIATGVTVLSAGIMPLTDKGGTRWLTFRVVAAIALWLPQLGLALLLSVRGVPHWMGDSPRAGS